MFWECALGSDYSDRVKITPWGSLTHTREDLEKLWTDGFHERICPDKEVLGGEGEQQHSTPQHVVLVFVGLFACAVLLVALALWAQGALRGTRKSKSKKGRARGRKWVV